MSDTDMIDLYSGRILAMATDMPRTARLSAPQATARNRSPLCGSTVTVDVMLSEGKVSDYGQDVKACVLGQAAAAVIGAQIIGLTPDQIRKGRDQLHAMLKDGGAVPDAPFDALEVLRPARDYKNRHASIMLAFDATLAALAELETDA